MPLHWSDKQLRRCVKTATRKILVEDVEVDASVSGNVSWDKRERYLRAMPTYEAGYALG